VRLNDVGDVLQLFRNLERTGKKKARFRRAEDYFLGGE
jgi:hypothetical protein